MVIIKLHPLFIYIMYMYVQKRYFPLWFREAHWYYSVHMYVCVTLSNRYNFLFNCNIV